MLFGVGCTPDEGGDAATDSAPVELTLSKTEAAVGLEGDTVQFDVTSNADWVVTPDQEGVEVTPATGKKNGTVTVTVPASSSVRTVNVTVTATKNRWYPELGQSFPDATTATLVIYQNVAGEIVEGGIASIKEAGTHEVEGAWVIATYAHGFLMTDNSGGTILVYQGNGATVPAVGQVVNVSGSVTLYGGLLQFGNTSTVSPVSGQTVPVATPSNPTVLDYAAVESYVNNPSIFYAEIKGKMKVKDSGKGYNNYNIELEGGSAVQGSVSYPATDLATKMDGLADAYVVARGYMIGKPNSNNYYANMMATSVEVDTNKSAIIATNIVNVPAEGAASATHNISVYGVSTVTATPDGTVVTAASVSGNVLTYTVAANTGTARQGSITLSAEDVESVTIKVAQLGAVESPEYNFMSDEALAYTASSGSTLKAYSCKTKVNGAEEVNGNGFKLGTGSYNGTFQSAALGVEGNATLEFYAVAWSGKSAKLYIRLAGTDTNLATCDLASNAGASNSEPYSITFADTDYYTVQLTGLTANSVLEFSTTAAYDASSNNSTGRALVVGAHIVGGTPSTPTTPEPEQPGGGETPETPTTPETPEGGETPETPEQPAGNYTLIESVANLVAGEYYVAGKLATYTSNSTTYDWTNYPYHFWTGTVSAQGNTSSNSDLLTVNGNESMTLDPNMSSTDAAKGNPAKVSIVAVDGKADTYYVKVGDQYLYSAVADTNRRMQLGSEPTEWVASNHSAGGIVLASNGANLGTAGATYNLIRSYKDASAGTSLKYGLVFFKEK